MAQGIDVLLRRSEELEDAVFEALEHIDFSVVRTDVRLDAGFRLPWRRWSTAGHCGSSLAHR